MSDCPFCAIVAGDAPAHLVDEDEHTVSFLDIAPFTRGHTLVVPRQHARDLFDIAAEDARAVMHTTHRVAARLRETLGADGMNLLQSNGTVAFQTVFHLHVHLIPRWHDDGISIPPWPKHRADDDALAALAGELRTG